MKVLCYSCHTHLLNLDLGRLAYPYRAEMFESVITNWRLPTGQLVTDIFCPRCGAFPFHHDPNIPGAKGVGPYLKTLGADGKPVIIHFDQIQALLSQLGVKPATPEPQGQAISPAPRVEHAPKMASCPSCGAKPGRGGKVRMHRKGCPEVVFKEPETPQDVPKPGQASPEPDPILKDLVAQVEGTSTNASPEASPEEVQDMLREREARLARGKPPAQTRAMRE